jgi:hypothetical protein
VSNLEQWLAAVFGHWQHWLGGSAIGSVVALAVVFVQSLFRNHIPAKQSAALFLLCFGVDVSYLAWQDQYLANQPREAPHNSVLAAAMQTSWVQAPASVPQSKHEAATLAADIFAFDAARAEQKPASPPDIDATATEWNRYRQRRDEFDRETLREFQTIFGTRINDVLNDLKRAGAETVEGQTGLPAPSNAADVKEIAVRLSFISKQ